MSVATMLTAGRAKDAPKRDGYDFDPTPPEGTTALVLAERAALAGHRVWEPAAGDGRMVDALTAAGVQVIAGSDVADRAGGRFALANFLEAPLPDGCTAIITNPPFNQAAKFIRRALGDHQIPYLALLLKSNFFHTAGRIGLHNRWPPTAVLPITFRLDFRGGRAPTMDCTWFIWDAAAAGTFRHQLLPKPKTAGAIGDLLTGEVAA
jgi:hypothetical protein